VILTTPVIREVYRTYGHPEITFHTAVPAVLSGNPLVRTLAGPREDSGPRDLVIDLDGACEMRPLMHIVDAYAAVAFSHPLLDKSTESFCPEADQRAVEDLLKHERVNGAAAVVIHPARSWENRTFGTRFWDRVCARLVDFGVPILVVGTRHDVVISDFPKMVRLTDRLTINQIGLPADAPDDLVAALISGEDGGYRMLPAERWNAEFIDSPNDMSVIAQLQAQPGPAVRIEDETVRYVGNVFHGVDHLVRFEPPAGATFGNDISIRLTYPSASHADLTTVGHNLYISFDGTFSLGVSKFMSRANHGRVLRIASYGVIKGLALGVSSDAELDMAKDLPTLTLLSSTIH
jgi:hypothetical protein